MNMLNFILSILLFLPCNGVQKKYINNSENFLISEKDSCFIDVTINNYCLEKDISSKLGDIDTLNCDPNCCYEYYNKNKTEKLSLLFYPGRLKNHCSYFIVSSVDTLNNTVLNILECKHFVSGNGVKIGDNIKNIKEKLNTNNIFLTFKKNITILKYKIDKQNYKCYEKLKKYNYPEYTAKYIFKDNKLIKFGFGFEYP